jgi:hypothetical protein
MLSADFNANATDWVRFGLDNKEEVLARSPQKPGVYMIRRDIVFGRFEGKSDICYIGCTKRGLKTRVKEYFHPGPTQLTNKKINEKMGDYRITLEISWKPSENFDEDTRIFERELLNIYEIDHKELPPFNRRH